MTLYHFFKIGGLSVEKKEACKLGEKLSDIHLSTFGIRPPKIIVPEIENPINDYPESFLSFHTGYIVNFLSEKYLSQ